MYTYTATIGRNYQPRLANTASSVRPMSLTAWSTFAEDVTAELLGASRLSAFLSEPTIEVHHGKGIWEGVEEESTKITLLREFPLCDHSAASLRGALAALAKEYGQDAIALTIGESELC